MSGYRSVINRLLFRVGNGQNALINRNELESVLIELERRKKRIILLEERVQELEALIKVE